MTTKSRAEMQATVDAAVEKLVTELGAVGAQDVARLTRCLFRAAVGLAFNSGMPRTIPAALNYFGATAEDVTRGLVRDGEIAGGPPKLTVIEGGAGLPQLN